MPELVIGIPCYNEGSYIIECLQSVAQNDLTDVQVIVSDNQSTDGSYEKIEHFLDSLPKKKRGSFVSVQHDENKGGGYNWLYSIRNSDSKYFMWMGAHDAISINFIASNLELIRANSNVAMVSGRAFATDPSTSGVKDLNIIYDFPSKDPVQRYIDSVSKLVNCTVLHSIFQRNALSGYKFHASCPSQDKIVIATILWFGKLLYNKNEAYVRRYFGEADRQEKAKTGIYVNESNNSLFFDTHVKNFRRLLSGSLPSSLHEPLVTALFGALCKKHGLPSHEKRC